MVSTVNPLQKQSTGKSVQIAVLQVFLIVLTLSLWKGWFEENYFLDCQIGRTNSLIASCATSNDLITAGPGVRHDPWPICRSNRRAPISLP